MAVFSPFSGRLIARFGPRATMTAGMLIGLLGLVLQAALEDTTAYGRLLPGFLCFGVALALVYAPMSTAAMAAMPDAKAGIASGVLAMNRVLAGSLLLAAAGSVFQSAVPEPTGESAGAYADAVSHALVPAILVMAIGTAMTWLLVRAPSSQAEPATANAQYRQHHRRFHL
jgi:MFS family permease